MQLRAPETAAKRCDLRQVREKERVMNEQELQGRINGLSMVVEMTLIEAMRQKHGDTDKALEAIRRELEGLIKGFETDLPASDFRTGSIDALRLVVDRLQGIFGKKE